MSEGEFRGSGLQLCRDDQGSRSAHHPAPDRAQPNDSCAGSLRGGTVSSSAPSTPARLTAGLAGAASVRAGVQRPEEVERAVGVDVRGEPRLLGLGRGEHARHAVVHRGADRVGRGREHGDRRDPLTAHAALVPQPGEREQRPAVDGVAERHALAARALGAQPLVPAVGDDQAAAIGPFASAGRRGACSAASPPRR